MTFDVSADAYARFMGRFSVPLATVFADWSGAAANRRMLDVGCGPGALTGVLVDRAGIDAVSAIDPSPTFVAAAAACFPDLDVRDGGAEALPFADDVFDIVLAQLVVQFMDDPVVGLREMARVTRAGGTVTACMWDAAGGGSPLSTFWAAVRDLDPHARDESGGAGARDGHLAQLFGRAGLEDIEAALLTVSVPFESFDEWWEPYTFGVGPAGAYVAALDAGGTQALRARCADLLPTAPFVVDASAWSARARA